jgi:polyphosphate kinase 2 (PPK2 family)
VQQELLLIKFWLQFCPYELLKRFEGRQKIPFKRFKITDADWHNRKQWDNYQIAVSDMIDRTSSEYAPWQLIEANDKYYARIKILKTVCELLEKKLKQI